VAEVPVRRRAFLLAGHGTPINATAFSPEGRHLAVAAPDGSVLILRLARKGGGQRLSDDDATLYVVRTMTDPALKAKQAALSPDGRYALFRLTEGVVVWDLKENKEAHRFTGHAGLVTALTFTPDGKTVVTAGVDKTVRAWATATGAEQWKTDVPALMPRLAVSQDGKTVAGATTTEVFLWSAGGALRGRFDLGRGDTVVSLAVAPDGGRLLLSTWRGVLLCDRQGKEERRFEAQRRGVRSLAFAPDGKTAYEIGTDGVARRWDLSTGEATRRFAHAGVIATMSLTPDGTRLITTSLADRLLRVWDAATGRELDRLSLTVLPASESCSDECVLLPDPSNAPVLWRLPRVKR
jgi:WD40 repeat protein